MPFDETVTVSIIICPLVVYPVTVLLSFYSEDISTAAVLEADLGR